MILIDTSVLIRYLRTHDAAIESVLTTNQIAVSVVTRAEILHGARDETDYQRLTAALDGFIQIGGDSGTWDSLARNLYLLRLNGTPIPSSDALIATIAIREGVELWTLDNHFTLVQPALSGLTLFSAPRAP